jgi:phage FluMu gp28-like protein
MTEAIALEALWKAENIPDRVVLIISPGLRQSLIPMDRIHSALDANPKLKRKVIGDSRSELHFSNGSRIIALGNNPERIRGYAATDIYLDEAAHFLNDEPIIRVLKPMLSSKKGSLCVVSTPFGKRGLFWNQYQSALEKNNTDPEVRVYDNFPSTLNPMITEEDLNRERADLTELEFKQEYCGEFIEEVDVCLPLELIISCVDSQLQLLTKGEPSREYVAGIDLAKQRDETVVIILEKVQKDGMLIVRHISAWSKMNYTEQISRIGQLSKLFHIDHSAVDQTGVGEAVLENLQAVLSSVEGVQFTLQTKVMLIDLLRLRLEQKKIVLPNDRKLIMQLNSLRYALTPSGNKVYQSPQEHRLHDDYLWALALSTYAANKPKAWYGVVGVRRSDNVF